MLEWMFWEQYSHEPYIAVRRFQRLYLKTPEADLDPKLKLRGDQALARMEAWLEASPFLVGQNLTCADICLLAYTRMAHEGGFELAEFPAVAAWVKRADAELGL
jgi:glutathione S-transferase